MNTKISKTIIIITCLLIGFVLGKVTSNRDGHILNDLQYANYRTLPYKMELIKAYSNYMDATESYLDEVNEKCDVSTGSDIHFKYLDARKRVDNLLYKEDTPDD